MLMTVPWWLPALCASFLCSGFAEVNRRYKMGGRRLSFWQLFLSAVFVLPVTLFLQWPTMWEFYAVAIINGVVMGMASIRQLRLAADFNGRVACLFMPFKVIIAFFLWLGLHYSEPQALFEDGWRMSGVMVVLLAMLGAFLYMARDGISGRILKHIIPISLCFAVLDIMVKMVMDVEGVSPLVSFIFVFMATASGAFTLFCFMLWRGKKKVWWTPNLLKAGSMLALFGMLGMVCLVYSLQLAPNPAYPTMIILLDFVWLLIFYRLIKLKDNISPVTGTVIVVCAMSLIALTS